MQDGTYTTAGPDPSSSKSMPPHPEDVASETSEYEQVTERKTGR